MRHIQEMWPRMALVVLGVIIVLDAPQYRIGHGVPILIDHYHQKVLHWAKFGGGHDAVQSLQPSNLSILVLMLCMCLTSYEWHCWSVEKEPGQSMTLHFKFKFLAISAVAFLSLVALKSSY